MTVREQLNTAEIYAIFKRIPAYSKLIYRLYREPAIPARPKLLLTAALGYLVSPVDLIPGLIPVAGQLDDVIVMLTLLRKALRAIPESTKEPVLLSSGLSMDIVEADLSAAKKAAGILARRAARAVLHLAKLTARATISGGKALLRLRRPPPPPPDWPPPD